TGAGAELIRFARSVGLVRGEWVAIDGSKFRAGSSSRSVREREVLERYLEEMEAADTEDDVVIDAGAVAAAVEELRQPPEAEGDVQHVQAIGDVNNQGDGRWFDRKEFTYHPATDILLCPAVQTLPRKKLARNDRAVLYAAATEVSGACALKSRWPSPSRRWLT